ncbi:MAG: peptidoglycan glycosyltransferase, partial [Lachnospiraceae bacterium]|nr:peptidoglycan glycosyltransferase [Lachnospiraceae bacterium]
YYTEEEIAAMSDEEKIEKYNQLWNNFCVSEFYEPGSTFKPFTIAAGLEMGVLTGEEGYTCGGMLHIGDHDIHCSNRQGHGAQSLKRSLENSCNVALMNIGQSIGKEEFCRYQKLFGFGEYTGIDLPGEALGLLYNAEDMDPASLATNSFGQNFNVTMTQLTAAFCALINGGDYYKPHVVRQIWDENGNLIENKNPTLLKRTISKETSDIIKDYMLGVVQEGTGAKAAVEGYDVGGKTGTAEKQPRGNGKYLVSFIGYAPQENPEVVVYAVIDEPNVAEQASSSYAMQLASDIMKEVFPYLGVKKSAANEDNAG